MATLARRTIAPARPRRANPQIAKLKDRLKAASRRARGRSGASDKERTLLTVAGSVALAVAEKKGVNIPTVAGIDPGLIAGAVCSLVLPRYLGGKNGSRVQALGDGFLAGAAARSVARGSVKVSGVEIGGVEIGADDDDLSSVSGVELD